MRILCSRPESPSTPAMSAGTGRAQETFRTIIRYMAKMHPEALRPNLDLIGVYGRYDDLYCLIGTPLENEMWGR